jgi:hypothetical protein
MTARVDEAWALGSSAHLRVVLVPISPRWFSASSLMLIPSVCARILMIFRKRKSDQI